VVGGFRCTGFEPPFLDQMTRFGGAEKVAALLKPGPG
jgi:hypothetical protein